MLSKTTARMLRQARSRQGRRKHGLALCEGVRCCEELLRHRPSWVRVLVCRSDVLENEAVQQLIARSEKNGIEVTTASREQVERAAATVSSQGVLALFRAEMAADEPSHAKDPFVFAIDRIADPGNLGTMLRTAAAVGLKEIWITEGTTDPFAPKAVRAGMGAQFHVTIRRLPTIAALSARATRAGLRRTWIAIPRGGVSCFESAFEMEDSVLVIGNEAWGSQAGESERCVSIPMPGTAESLNAAQAATILLFEAVRRGLVGRKSTSP